MSNQRKQIIVNEILFWKKNKMLPDHYCDFLMTLYTEGNNEQEEELGDPGQSIKAKEKRKNIGFFIALPLVAIVLLAIVYTVDIVWLAAIPASLMTIACFIGAFYFAKKNKLLAPILQLCAALLLLGLTVKLCLTYFAGNHLVLYSALIINCVIWFLSGLKLKLTYFTISGALGILAIIIYGSMNV
ncbi:hypothetical protein [Lysinibacillus sp. 54212]|uniref:hypothetical protein n=1 Tax=Lysinibacillus sp. 54212 TaxID=3119829 RepID=UPI002FC71D80